jgi:hypothetical protein
MKTIDMVSFYRNGPNDPAALGYNCSTAQSDKVQGKSGALDLY